MTARYVHTGLIARDPERLAAFYAEVLGASPLPRRLRMRGRWLDEAAGLDGARASGLHVRLPGHGPDGPTVEILRYEDGGDVHPRPPVDAPGLGHLAFEVDDLPTTLAALGAHGGNAIGTPARTEIPGRGTLDVVFARDPEGNVVELQHWS